ncbi:NYN domain-containing protein [Aerosakkonemataceae cyanobacterium BLCC-F167]|uniref:NYN domain-containing protein n=2 Tax=Floridanema TaxID=3396149 RepID=A0ABV4WP62_9CYAN
MQKISARKELVAILVDIQNVLSIPKYGKDLENFATLEGRLNCFQAYYNSYHQNQVSAINTMQNIGCKGIDVLDPSKNSADKQLICDCIQLVASRPSLKKIILVLGDRDYAGLISVLLSLGKRVIIFAQRGSASPKLAKLVGDKNFHFIEELPKLVGEQIQLVP